MKRDNYKLITSYKVRQNKLLAKFMGLMVIILLLMNTYYHEIIVVKLHRIWFELMSTTFKEDQPVLTWSFWLVMDNLIAILILTLVYILMKREAGNFFSLLSNISEHLKGKNSSPAQALKSSNHFLTSSHKYNKIYRNITHLIRKNSKQAILSSRTTNLLGSYYQETSEAIILTNSSGKIEQISQYFMDITGYSLADVKGKGTRFLYDVPKNKLSYSQAVTQLKDRGRWRGELILVTKSGSHLVMLASISLKKELGTITYLSDISAQKHKEDLLFQMSYMDSLTNIPNHREFEIVAMEWVSENKKFIMTMMDVDKLKYANTVWGHNTGDNIIIEAARVFSVLLPPSTRIFRLSGDEFIGLTPASDQNTLTKKQSEISKILLRSVIDLYPHDKKIEYELTFRMGAVVFPDDNINGLSELVASADLCLRDAKYHQSLHPIWYSELSKKQKSNTQLTLDIKKALQGNKIYSVVQPIIDSRQSPSNRVIGIEMLVRWKHPTHGMIPPEQIIRLLKESDHIPTLVSKQFDELQSMLPKLHERFPDSVITINLLPETLLTPGFFTLFNKKFTKKEAKHIVFEVHESPIKEEQFDAVIEVLNLCRMYGVKIALDDYGKGHSSLNRLLEMEIDYLKLDSSFIQSMTKSGIIGKKSRILIASVRDICQHLPFTLLAEGVETVEQSSLLNKDGIYIHQGFLYGKPLLFSDFISTTTFGP